MPYVEFISELHNRTRRNYLERVVEHDKAACAEVAIQWGRDYWDGDRQYGYGGYRYDGRWRSVAEKIASHYQLPKNARILDIGCGKGFLLYEFTQILPEAQVVGIDVSEYGIENSKPEIRDSLQIGNAVELPFEDHSFDFVYSINTFHNLYNMELDRALKEMTRVAKGPKWFVVESYRNEKEKVNLLYWQLTCRSFYTPDEWKWFCDRSGYNGDYSFIFFEDIK